MSILHVVISALSKNDSRYWYVTGFGTATATVQPTVQAGAGAGGLFGTSNTGKLDLCNFYF